MDMPVDGPIIIRLCRLPHGNGLELPTRMSADAAGLDLPAAVDADLTLELGQIRLIPCGFSMAIPRGFEGQVRPRSGLASRHGITLVNSPGTIDADYRGEVRVPLINLGPEPFTITRGMRIAQMLILPVPAVQVIEVDQLDDTPRGSGGFGSSGH
jgi:dUTP diphosphatase